MANFIFRLGRSHILHDIGGGCHGDVVAMYWRGYPREFFENPSFSPRKRGEKSKEDEKKREEEMRGEKGKGIEMKVNKSKPTQNALKQFSLKQKSWVELKGVNTK